MKISYNWLKEYIQTDLTPDEIGVILTDIGLEVEGIEKIESIQGGLAGVIVAHVLTCEKHPDADKLKVTTVDTGRETLQVVCGAPNVGVGQKVVLATVGSTLYPKPEESFKIKVSKIRGVESFGMLCAEDELGIGTSHEGIMILDSSLAPGTPMAEVLALEDDYQFEIGLTPNRADAMGVIGVARDLKAFLNTHQKAKLDLNWPSVDSFKVSNDTNAIKITIDETDRCSRYTGTVIHGIEVKPSPAWLQKRLRAVGLSPINNVVDCTNYVMRELGTPLHAFDADKLGGQIVVKTMEKGTVFKTLDGIDRTLSDTDLMITNGEQPLCIAGVFGGLDSGIHEGTKTVFLESAYFNPVSVRKTARFHGLNTDASFRFERGVDPALTLYALKRTALLIQEVAGGEITMNPVDVFPKQPTPKHIEFNYDRCDALIGFAIEESIIDTILAELDIHLISKNQRKAMIEIPHYRVDVTREADVIEEVLRIYGFNNIPNPEKLNASIGVYPKPDVEKIQHTLAEFLVGKGFVETMNNSLTTSSYIEKFGGSVLSPERNVRILNPLSQDLDIMRQTLIFNVLEVVEHNQNRQQADLKLFEFGKVYHKYESGYSENKRLILAVSGKKEYENWNNQLDTVSFYSIKGYVLSLIKRLGLSTFLKEDALKNSLLEDGLQLSILKKKVGELGWIDPAMKKAFGLKQDVFVADLDWDALIDSLKLVKVNYQELPKTFAVRRDFSLLIEQQVSFKDIVEVAQGCDKKILKDVGLFDVYEGKNLDEGKKSYAVSFTFQDNEQTLKDAQIDAVMDKIRAALNEKLNAQLR